MSKDFSRTEHLNLLIEEYGGQYQQLLNDIYAHRNSQGKFTWTVKYALSHDYKKMCALAGTLAKDIEVLHGEGPVPGWLVDLMSISGCSAYVDLTQVGTRMSWSKEPDGNFDPCAFSQVPKFDRILTTAEDLKHDLEAQNIYLEIPESAKKLLAAKAKAEMLQRERECEERNAKNISAQHQREQAAAAKKKREEEGEAIMRAWALEKGSELLKARVEHKFDWRWLAREEWVTANLQIEGFDVSVDECDGGGNAVTEPDLEQIKGYRTLLAHKLIEHVQIEDCSYSYNGQWWYEVEVETPDGQKMHPILTPQKSKKD